ncbi:unnamed protein product [Zymoseptoria tritici ST99CH_1A5]|uniref:Uncharacterized protein n=1 Tax=Zymoseptoria tritici ST99CH_1A5 TaxID=1276529 RepID=A0A1Y6LUL0_ZYMTR|nr:unnamed protein product [Zymoseptoria tritici ST99CH_1A5]
MDPANTPLVTGDDFMSARQPVSDNAAPSTNHVSPTADLFKTQAADEQDCCTATSEAGFDCTSPVGKKWSRPTNTDFDETAHTSSCAVCAGLRADKSEPASPTSDASSTAVASSQMDASSSCGTSPISERFQHPQEPQAVTLDDHPTRAGQTACKCHHGIRYQSNEQVEAPPVHRITKSSVPTKVAAKQDPAASRVPDRTKYSVPSNTASEIQMPLPEVGQTSACQYHLSRRVPHNDSMRSTDPACSIHSPEPGREDICQCSGSKCSSRKKQLSVPGKDRPTKSSLIERTTKQLCSFWADITDVVQPDRIWHYCVGVMGTAIRVLKAPLGLLLGLFALLFFFQLWLSTVEALFVRTTGMVCALPLVGRFSFCPRVETTPIPYIAESAERNNDLAYLQSIASDTAALPYHLIVGETGFKDMIFEVSAIDLPSKQQLMPHLENFNHLLRDAVNGIQDSLAMTNALVDNTILTNEWAQEELQEIEARERSLTSIITRSLGVRTGSVQELAKVFTGMTTELFDQSTKVVIQHTDVRGILTAIKDLLDAMAMIFKRDNYKLEKDKLNQASYWKEIMASHREKMHDFDQKMVLCAKFYNYTLQAGRIITVTNVALQEITGNVKAMQDELSRAPKSLAFTSGSLKLAIATIGASTNDLKDSRSRSKLEQKKRVVEFKRIMASQNA